ncbi:AlpA family phage regulatory protein [Rhodanobacter denitrificans]|uniref:AlpA family phage regulatory protein n=1 Tax=Rhodanobacter denitrificans TaxID=666685 RepID=A0A368KBY6_9GAMM|nr:AlpA family phage regulatory protein [Rhodanobacter denitrificans]RCS28606.1 AlpA family phage regulatory protein [Rhodanobacter denitrificans]
MLDETSFGLRILSVRETAKRLNIGRSTLYAWLDEKSSSCRLGLPKPVHLGKSTGFIEHEIDDFIRGLMQARGGAVGL